MRKARGKTKQKQAQICAEGCEGLNLTQLFLVLFESCTLFGFLGNV